MTQEQFPQYEYQPIELASKPADKDTYIPPVGPGSKSLPPSGDYRDLPPGFIPTPPKRKK